MTNKLKIVGPAVLLLFSSSALAGDDWDLETACHAYVGETPESTLDCSCLVDGTGDNEDLLASYKAAATEDAELTEEAGVLFGECSAA